MQLNSVYLYYNKLDVFTSLSDTWLTERYRRVYNRNLKIFRGVDNRIDIQVRNTDQKTVNITGSTLVFNLIAKDSKDLVLQKDTTAMDLDSGKVTVTLTADELLDLTVGFYDFSIVKEIRNTTDSTEYIVTSRMPMYSDSQYDVLGTLEITGDVYGDLEKSLVIDTFNYINPVTQGEVLPPAWFVSQIIDAKPTTRSARSVYTFQFYSTNYDGSVVIQGSLDLQGGSPREMNWSDITSVNLAYESYKNVTGKYNWFRIKHIPTGSSNTASFVISQTISLSYLVNIYQAGNNYQIGDTITILGNRLGGEQVTNDLIITVTGVDTGGKITGISWTGLSYPGVKTFVLSGTSSTIGTIDKILFR